MGLLYLFLCASLELVSFFNLLIYRFMNEKMYRLCCSCTPQEGIVRMDARTLNQVEKEGREFINQAHGLRKKAHRALQLGDICQKAGYPHRAIDIWETAISDIAYRDYKWVSVPIDTSQFRLCDVVSEYESRQLAFRVDSTWRQLGHQEMIGAMDAVRENYHSLWFDKYYEALP